MTQLASRRIDQEDVLRPLPNTDSLEAAKGATETFDATFTVGDVEVREAVSDVGATVVVGAAEGVELFFGATPATVEVSAEALVPGRTFPGQGIGVDEGFDDVEDALARQTTVECGDVML